MICSKEGRFHSVTVVLCCGGVRVHAFSLCCSRSSCLWYSPSISRDVDVLAGLRLILVFGTTVRCCAVVLCIIATRITSAKHVAAAAPRQQCFDSMLKGSLWDVTTGSLKHTKSFTFVDWSGI
jgi:hypothetical protein